MNKCKGNYTETEILENFGGSISPEKEPCASCNNLKYEHGILLCDAINKGKGNNYGHNTVYE